ncbi:MAG: AAA family ATPase [Halobacteriovoraceae bacterium]|nr:AAA family ATPase [Halobacteriovoraceae bacterium]
MKRILIIGNSGSGKTWLSEKISSRLNVDVIHFDKHFWEPGGFNKKRERPIVLDEIQELSKKEKWVMEGVFGELAEVATPRGTHLIFLDKNWSECNEALLSRGSESSSQLSKEDAKNNFDKLIRWAEEYYNRESKASHHWHEKMYKSFHGGTTLLKNRSETMLFLKTLK